MLMRIYQWILVGFITGVATAFFWPYVFPQPAHALDALWSTNTPRTLMFQQDSITEQWQIVPLPIFRRAVMVPSEVFLAWPTDNNAGYMIERTIITSSERTHIREYYARQAEGDYLVGLQQNGVVVQSFIPPILVRPTQFYPPRTWESVTVIGRIRDEGSGCFTLTIEGTPLTNWSEQYCDGALRSFQHPPSNNTLVTTTQITSITPIDAPGTPPDGKDATLHRVGSIDVLKFTNGPLGRLVYDERQQQVIGSLLGGYIVAIDSRTGAERWRLIGDGEWYSQPIYDPFQRLIVAADTSGTVHAIDGDGRVAWQYAHAQVIVADPCATPDGIVIADTNGTVLLLDTRGSVVWHTDIRQPVSATPVWDEAQQAIIVVTQSGRIQAFDTTGNPLWTQGIDGSVQADPTLHAGSIYVVDESGTLYALDTANGEIRWDFASQATPTWSATASQNTVVVANEQELWIVNALGEQIGGILADSTAMPTLIGTALYTINEKEIRIWNTDSRTYHLFDLRTIHQANDTDREPLRVTQPAALSGQGVWWGDASGRVIAVRHVTAPPLLPVRWQRSTLDADIRTLAFEHVSIVDETMLVMSDRFNTLFYVNTADGAFVKRTTVPGESILAIASNTGTSHTAIVQNNGITAFVAGTTQKIWHLPLNNITRGILYPYKTDEWLAWIQVSNSTYYLVRINAQGNVVWQQSFTDFTDHTFSFTDDVGMIGGTMAIDLLYGDIIWQLSSPMYAHFFSDTSICGFMNDQAIIYMHCVQQRDGAVTRHIPTQLRVMPTASVAHQDGAFVSTSDHFVSFVDTQGNLVWQSITEIIPIVQMQAYKRHALVIRNDGRIQLFAAQNSSPIAVVNDLPINYMTNIDAHWRNDIPIDNDMLYVWSNAYVFNIDLSGVGNEQ